MSRDLVEAAAWLLEHDLCRSAVRLLDASGTWGFRVNELRQRARAQAAGRALAPGFYGLATLPDRSQGVVIPVRARIGVHTGRPWSREALDAEALALDLARRATCGPGEVPPGHCLVLPDTLALIGGSLGLAAALEFVSHLTGVRPTAPVLATGRLSTEGRVQPVEAAATKLEAAAEELSDAEAIVLAHPSDAVHAPDGLQVTAARALDDAIACVFGEQRLRIRPELLSLAVLLDRSRGTANHGEAIAVLEAAPRGEYRNPDLALLLLELGRRYRHAGRTREAAKTHSEASRLFREEEPVLGPVALEEMELEALATDMDQYCFEHLEAALRERLSRPFLQLHDRIRCQGMLAQLLSTEGRHLDEAIRLRQDNLALQEQGSEPMRVEVPATLARLTLECAMAGRRDLFERFSARMLETTREGDAEQSRYNDSAVIRGLVLLGAHNRALGWASGDAGSRSRRAGQATIDLLEGEATVETHPEVSTARALIRSLRHTGRPGPAIELGRRCTGGAQGPLVQWLARLAQVEAILALHEAGRGDEAAEGLRVAKADLRHLFPPAAAYHEALLATLEVQSLDHVAVQRIEQALDRVYY